MKVTIFSLNMYAFLLLLSRLYILFYYTYKGNAMNYKLHINTIDTKYYKNMHIRTKGTLQRIVLTSWS